MRTKFLLKQSPVLLIVLVLTLLTGAVFSPVLQFDFINYDDPDYVTSNKTVQKGITWEGVKWAFTTGHASNWHPLTWISHMLDWQMYGDKAGRHHLTALLFHIANTLLLFAVLRRMTGALWRSAFVAALFALHPLHVESVAWIAERKDVLSTFFWMLTTLFYVRYVQAKAANAGGAGGNYVAALVFFACGLMSKPMLVTLPFVLLLLDYWPLNRVIGANTESRFTFYVSRYKALVLEKVPYFALTAISSYITFRVQRAGGAVTKMEVLSIVTRIENAFISYPRYLGKMFWPDDLAVLYPHPWKWPLGLALAAVLFMGLTTALVVWQGRKRPYLAVGWFWFVGTLVPVIGIVQVGLQSIADRYTYVPLIGIFIAIAWGVNEFATSRKYLQPKLAPAVVIILLACVATTWTQVHLWRDSGTLFEHALKVTEKNFLAHNNLGYHLYNKGKEDEAMVHYRAALEIYPQFEVAWNNMGYALAGKERYEEAIIHYRQALKLNPKHAHVYNNMGNALGNIGRQDEAIQAYYKTLELDPEHADAHNNLGVALAQEGKLDEGIAHILKSISLKPRNASAHSNLGNALAIKGKLDEAIAQYEIAIGLKPEDPQSYNNLGNVLANKNRLEEAIANYRTALKLESRNPEAHCNLGFALARAGNMAEARSHLVEAIRLRPNYPDAQRYLSALDAQAK